MITRLRTRPTISLPAVRNARTRIYAAGADPKFSRSVPAPTFRLEPAFPAPDASQARKTNRLWSPQMLDRLQTPLTHYPE
jgi:hypothetical protein